MYVDVDDIEDTLKSLPIFGIAPGTIVRIRPGAWVVTTTLECVDRSMIGVIVGLDASTMMYTILTSAGTMLSMICHRDNFVILQRDTYRP